MTEPTIDEQIAFEKKILPIAAGGMHQAILASLERLKRIHAVLVPDEPDVLVKRLRNEADRLDPPHAHEFNEKGQRLGHPGNVVVLLRKSADHIDTLRDLLRRVTAERDSCAQTNDDQSRRVFAAEAELAEAKLLLAAAAARVAARELQAKILIEVCDPAEGK